MIMSFPKLYIMSISVEVYRPTHSPSTKFYGVYKIAQIHNNILVPYFLGSMVFFYPNWAVISHIHNKLTASEIVQRSVVDVRSSYDLLVPGMFLQSFRGGNTLILRE